MDDGYYRRLVEAAPLAIVVVDAGHGVASERGCTPTPWPPGHPRHERCGRLAGHESAGMLGHLAHLVTAEPTATMFRQVTLATAAATSETRHLELRGVNRLADSELAGVVITAVDVTEQQQRADRLAEGAFTDELTGLLNRRALDERMRNLSRSPGPPAAMLFLDLDQFKMINDRHGHHAGDQILIVVSQRLRSVVQQRDDVLLARLGGDEFGIALTGTLEEAAQVGLQLLAAVRQPIERPMGIRCMSRVRLAWQPSATACPPSKSLETPTSPCTPRRRAEARASRWPMRGCCPGRSGDETPQGPWSRCGRRS